MKFTGINNTFYSQFLKATPNLLKKLNDFQECLQVRTLGRSRWKVVAARRNRMSRSSSFIDLYDVLKLMALQTGFKRDFLAASRHLLIKDENRKEARNMIPSRPTPLTPSTTMSLSSTNDFQLAGYSEPMRRWLKDKYSADTVHTYHPVYRSFSCDDYENDPNRAQLDESEDGILKSIHESVVESSVRSEMSRIERKVKRRNSQKGILPECQELKNETSKNKVRRQESTETVQNCALVIPLESDSDESGDFTDYKFTVIGTPYRKQIQRDGLKGQKRYSL
jgi:hypothetical protein